MREKQQKTSPRALNLWRAATVLAVVCAVGGLAGPALATPSAATPSAGPVQANGFIREIPQTAGDLAVTGVPVAIGVIPQTHTTDGAFWVVSSPGNSESTSNVAEINESTSAIKNFTPPNGVIGVATDPTLGLAWILSSSGGGGPDAAQALTKINETAGTATTLSLSGITPHLEGIAVDPATSTVLAVDYNGDVYALSETGTLTAPSSPLVTGPGATDAADGIAVDPSSGHIWVTSQGNDSVSAYAQNGSAVGRAVALGQDPTGAIAVDSSSGTVWVGTSNSAVSEFSDASPGTPKTVTVSGVPASLSIASGAGQVWVADNDGMLDQIAEGPTPSVAATYNPASGASLSGAAVDPATGEVWSAVENDGASGDNVFPLVPSAPAITSASSVWFATNPPSTPTFQITSSGFPAPTFAESGKLPSGVTLNTKTGVLSGTPAAIGTYAISLTAHNSLGTSASQAFTLHVGSYPVFTTPSSFTFYTGLSVHLQIHANGVPAPSYGKAIPLPSGLTLSSSGLLSGTPAKATPKGTYYFLAFNTLGTVPQVVTITVLTGHAAKITSAAKATFKPGKKGTFTIKSTGTPTPSLSVSSGKLPKGLTFKAGRRGTATIVGTAARSDKKGSYKITIKASNGVGKAATQVLTITIS
jgi:hypothetical protein